MSVKGAAGAVVLSAPVTAMSAGTAEALLSLFLGLAGVALARQVFLNRERRTTGKRQTFAESLPLTLCAMLVTGALVWERKLGLTFSVFTGLGVGWTAILLLDLLGELIVKRLRMAFGLANEGEEK